MHTRHQAYWRESMNDSAVITLFCRRLPKQWTYLITCGVDDALHCLESLRFTGESIAYLRSLSQFKPAFLDALSRWRFSGDVYAVAEGTPVCADEPILEVVAPVVEAQGRTDQQHGREIATRFDKTFKRVCRAPQKCILLMQVFIAIGTYPELGEKRDRRAELRSAARKCNRAFNVISGIGDTNRWDTHGRAHEAV